MSTVIRRGLLGLIALLAMLPAFNLGSGTPGPAHADDPAPIQGTSETCVNFKLDILSSFITDVLELGVLDDLGVFDIDEEVFKADLPDEGWVWVDPDNPYREVEGLVVGSHTASVDFPATHDSHDQNTIVRVDPEYKGVLALVNQPNEEGSTNLVPPENIEMEWEHGTYPSETGRNEPERFYPRWSWAAIGDRVWTEGHWAIDCGHATTINGVQHFRTEIHPARASAAMRQQVATLPGSGTTEVPVTATDLYIHGRSGFIVEVLTHGQEVITDDIIDPSHSVDDHLMTPIDSAYAFEVCLPEKPSPGAVPAYWFENGPGNTIAVDPELTVQDATGPCLETGNKELLVEVDLTNSGAAPTDVYARKIYTGWIYPDQLRHFTVKLDQMDLHEDHEVELSLGGDCECTFFYVNVDQAADEWFRLADWWEETCNISIDTPLGSACIDHNTLNDYDSDELLGNGLLDFSGPTWDFLVPDGQPFHIRSSGYDQDCQDGVFDQPLLNDHFWDAVTYSICYYGAYVTNFESGRNDGFDRLNVCFIDTDEHADRCEVNSTEHRAGYGVGFADLPADQYDMEFTISEETVTEDDADLAVAKDCTHEGEVALAGETFTCTVIITNDGPGLPSNVVLDDTLATALPASAYTLGTPTFTVAFGGETGDEQSCTVTPPNTFSCAIGTVPVGGSATVTVDVTPTQPGTFTNTATVTSDTTDPDGADDSASDTVQVYLPVQIDIRPGLSPNPINLSSATGTIPVAVIRTADFDPATININSVCFGDAEAPSERDCTETHGRGHLQDIDKDRDADLLLHYEVAHVGIDLGDTSACLIGATTGGIGIYGCDSVVPVP